MILALTIDPGLLGVISALITAIVAIVTVVFAFKTAALKIRAEVADEKLKEHDKKIAEVIKTSDGMKDALVQATAKASHIEGVMQGVTDTEAKNAILAKGISNGIEKHKQN